MLHREIVSKLRVRTGIQSFGMLFHFCIKFLDIFHSVRRIFWHLFASRKHIIRHLAIRARARTHGAVTIENFCVRISLQDNIIIENFRAAIIRVAEFAAFAVLIFFVATILPLSDATFAQIARRKDKKHLSIRRLHDIIHAQHIVSLVFEGDDAGIGIVSEIFFRICFDIFTALLRCFLRCGAFCVTVGLDFIRSFFHF